ncbi:MAG: tetratricopeptide repeat protein [Flavobacteriaceae bacterium]|nr:tetratricopeptide repeat protein [Flavobacteriaceae bacterium]
MKKNYLLIFLVFVICLDALAQTDPVLLDKEIDSVLNTKATSYKDINDILNGMRKDTLDLLYIIKRFDEKDYPVGGSYALNMLGTKYRNISEYSKAIDWHKKALEEAEKADNIEFRVFSLNMLGVDYRRMDANRTALDYNHEALALAETVKDPSLGLRRSIAVSHNSMGNIYLLLKQYDLAINQFEQSLTIEKSINNELGLAINNQNIGYAKQAQGQLEDALKYYQESLDLNEKINNPLGKIICNNSIANIYIEQGDPKKAVKLIEENLPKAINLGDKYYIAFQYINLGWAQSKLSDYKRAESNLLKGLDLSKKYNIPSAISEAYYHLSELAEKTGEYKNSLQYYKMAEEFDEKISNERTVQYVNDLIIKYDSERKNSQITELASQNEIAELKLTRNRNIWIISVATLILTASILYLLYKQRLNRNEKRILMLEQDLLRTQMNPHFIFNTLNSIKHYIINNEQQNAVYYLNKFSKLMRQILENSSAKEICLSKELETMNLYLNIENIRFSNEIVYTMEVDENVDPTYIKVPPMILQPFLENAIWHGLSSKKGKKTIDIHIKKPNVGFIEITIEDNGIGRDEANQIKSKKTLKRKSFGLEITRERLENFVKNKQRSFDIAFEDLTDRENKPRGTRVILTIPLI